MTEEAKGAKARRLGIALVALLSDQPVAISLNALFSAASVVAQANGISYKNFLVIATAGWKLFDRTAEKKLEAQSALATGLRKPGGGSVGEA